MDAIITLKVKILLHDEVPRKGPVFPRAYGSRLQSKGV